MTISREELLSHSKATALLMTFHLSEEKFISRPASFSRWLVVRVHDQRRARGGAYRNKTGRYPGITIPLWYTSNDKRFDEYPSFKDDPEIGSFISEDFFAPIEACVAHELAHAVIAWNKEGRAHGPEWKYAYRFLRRRNDLVIGKRVSSL